MLAKVVHGKLSVAMEQSYDLDSVRFFFFQDGLRRRSWMFAVGLGRNVGCEICPCLSQMDSQAKYFEIRSFRHESYGIKLTDFELWCLKHQVV